MQGLSDLLDDVAMGNQQHISQTDIASNARIANPSYPLPYHHLCRGVEAIRRSAGGSLQAICMLELHAHASRQLHTE